MKCVIDGALKLHFLTNDCSVTSADLQGLVSSQHHCSLGPNMYQATENMRNKSKSWLINLSIHEDRGRY